MKMNNMVLDTKDMADACGGVRWHNEESKPNPAHHEHNPTGEAKADAGKPDWSLLDLDLLTGAVSVLTYGAEKYKRDGWKSVPDAKNRYFAALMRHLTSHQMGEKNDPDTGLSHLDHALCNLIFLKGFEEEK